MRPMITLRRLRRLLRHNLALPKEGLIDSSRWRLSSNSYRIRDRNAERALLHALTGPGSSPDEHQQALLQANCRGQRRCNQWSCFVCRQRYWFHQYKRVVEHFASMRRDDLSFCTIIAGVTHLGPFEAQAQIEEAKEAWESTLARYNPLQWIGRFEVDYLLAGESHLGSFKLKSLLELGYLPDCELGALVPHLHAIVCHPNVNRKRLTYWLHRALRGRGRVQVRPMHENKAVRISLENLVRYPLKHRVPPEIMPVRGSDHHMPRNPEQLRYFNRTLCVLGGLYGCLRFDGLHKLRRRLA
jgi:hypothetical protein